MAGTDPKLDLERREHTQIPAHHSAAHQKPEGFERAFETTEKTEFQRCDDQLKPIGEKGVLEQGKVVWGSPDLAKTAAHSESEPVYVEARGLVLLNPRLLRESKTPPAGTGE